MIERIAVVVEHRKSPRISSQDGRGALHPTALQEGLSGWILLTKDLLKKIRLTIEEATLLLGSLDFLRLHKWRSRGREGLVRPAELASDTSSPAAKAVSSFSKLYDILALHVAELQRLHEAVREDLLLLELLLLDDHTYADLAEPCPATGIAAVLPRPDVHRCDGDAYIQALQILWTTDRPTVLLSAHAVLERWAAPTGEGKATRRRTIAGAILTRLAEGSQRPSFQVSFLRVTLALQEQPYCQPARLRRLLLVHEEESPKARLDKCIVDLLDKTSGRTRVLIDAIEEVLKAFSLDPDNFTSLLDSASLPEKRPEGFGSGLEFILRQKVEGAPTREAIVEFVVDLASQCWEHKRLRVLARVAQFRRGDVPEVDGSVLNPIHEHLFRRVCKHHFDLETSFSNLRAVVQAVHQRAAILPPSFPAVPRFHRREREVVEASLLELLPQLSKRARALVGRLRERGEESLPELLVDLSFDHVFSSSMREMHEVEKMKAVTIVVPFFHLDIPRHLADVAHEISHAYIVNDDIALLLDVDRETWNRAAAEYKFPLGHIIRHAGGRLHRSYIELGTPPKDEAGLIAEVLADLVAMLVAGPHYLYSLLFTTIGRADLPDHGDGPPLKFVGPTEISPMVRLGALLRAASHMKWIGDKREQDAYVWPDTLPRMRPVISMCKAYFRFLRGGGARDIDAREMRRAQIFEQEIEILGDCLCDILNALDLPESERFAYVPGDGDNAAAAAELLDETMRGIVGAAPSPPDRSRPRWHLFRNVDETRREFVLDNALHLLWSVVLDPYKIAARQLSDAGTDRARRREAVERVLWLRVPEARALTTLLGYTDPSQPTEDPSPQLGRRKEMIAGDIVTVVQIDAFWGEGEEVGVPVDEPSSWVIGDYDFHHMGLRFGGVEDLSQASLQFREHLPVVPRHAYLRHLDYLVVRPSSGREGAIARAFIQVRLTTGGSEGIPRAREMAEMAAAIDGGEAVTVLQSFGWDHYAFVVPFETFQGLSTWMREARLALVKRGCYVDSSAVNLILPGGSFALDAPVRVDLFPKPARRPDRPAVSFVTRFRGNSPNVAQNGQLVARSAVDDAQVACRKLIGSAGRASAIELHVMSATGADGIQLTLSVWTRTLNRKQCAEVFRIYQKAMLKVAPACHASDMRTTVLLPSATGRPPRARPTG